MAGWISSTGSGIGTGRGAGAGAGGRGFPNRRYTSDASSAGGSSRWRGERSRGRPPPQPHYRYRPVDASHRHSSPSVSTEQETFSTSTRHAQMTHPAAATDKSPSSAGTVAPASSNKDPEDLGSRSAANFECNVCFDMAEEPVVTKCGHLFCWECLYQWLHVHSQARECPVCKGEVAEDAIIPIYGRGGSGVSVKNAPPRPTGARVESSRQQQHSYQQHTSPHDMVFMDDEEDNPFDFPSMVDFGFGGTPSLREAMRSFMSPSFHDVDMDGPYDSYELYPEDFEEVYDYSMVGFPVFASSGTEFGNPSSSHMHADLIDLMDNDIPVHHGEFSYSGAPQSRNRGWHGRRHRARASADQSSTDAMVTGSSGTYYRDNSANSNGSVGASSRPNVGWVERRGRSNRNSNSTGGRGMHDGRRQRTNYN